MSCKSIDIMDGNFFSYYIYCRKLCIIGKHIQLVDILSNSLCYSYIHKLNVIYFIDAIVFSMGYMTCIK